MAKSRSRSHHKKQKHHKRRSSRRSSRRSHRRSHTRKHRGGSVASDIVMSNLTGQSTTQVVPEGCPLKGDMASLNLYKTTGGGSCGAMPKQAGGSNCGAMPKQAGGSRNNKSKSKSKSKKTKKSKSRRSKSMRGGGSDWIASQYSQGPINNPVNTLTGQFSVSAGADRDVLMNPPNLGSAGSGYPMGDLEGANTRHVGAPF